MYLYDFHMNAFTCFGPLRPSSEGTITCQGNYYYIDHSIWSLIKVFYKMWLRIKRGC
jgi:hypothetical protein